MTNRISKVKDRAYEVRRHVAMRGFLTVARLTLADSDRWKILWLDVRHFFDFV